MGSRIVKMPKVNTVLPVQTMVLVVSELLLQFSYSKLFSLLQSFWLSRKSTAQNLTSSAKAQSLAWCTQNQS